MLMIKSDIAAKLCAHARAEYPWECCGIILGECNGEGKIARRVIETVNAVGVGREAAHFRIDPLAIAKAEREPLEILGFYHSHPDCEAIPSKEDIVHILAGYSYLIISVYSGVCSDMRSFERLSQLSEYIKEEILIKEQ